MSLKKKQSLVTGAAILGAAALIVKILGAIYRIPYQNITGDVGLAVYNKVYPIYSMLLILATAGFPIAVSKIVSERLALGDTKGAKRVFIISQYVLIVTGLVFFAILFFGSGVIANLMGNPDLTIAIKGVSFALLIVPVMAGLRGYYQGHQYMTPTAISQIIEQLVRVITILVLSYWFINNGYSVYYAGAGAVFGATTGAIAALIVLIFFWNKIFSEKETDIINETFEQVKENESLTDIIKVVLLYSIPIAVSALILPLLGVVDSFSVTNILTDKITNSEYLFGFYIKGYNLVDFAEYWFGIFTRGQPLVQFAAFFATALFLALVPSISEAHAKKNKGLIIKRTELALRLTLLIGLPASIGLAVLAEPINIMLYKDSTGSLTMAILAFSTIFSTLFVTSSGVLQGIGKVILPAKNLIIGIIIKVILNIVLIYKFHINGAAMATVLTFAFATLLNIFDIYRLIKLRVNIISFIIKPVLAALMMGIIVYLTKSILLYSIDTVFVSKRILMTVVTLSAVMVGVVTFGFSLFISGALTKTDLEQIPKYGSKFAKIAGKLKILKEG